MENKKDRDKNNAAGVEELEEQRRTEDTDAPDKQGGEGEATDKPIKPTTGPTTADPNDPGTEPGQTQGSGL